MRRDFFLLSVSEKVIKFLIIGWKTLERDTGIFLASTFGHKRSVRKELPLRLWCSCLPIFIDLESHFKALIMDALSWHVPVFLPDLQFDC